MASTYTCGGCGLPYVSGALSGPERAVCPRCNPGKTNNVPVEVSHGLKLRPWQEAILDEVSSIGEFRRRYLGEWPGEQETVANRG